MNFPKLGKSIWKGLKYTGLAFGGAAVGALADGGVVAGVLVPALTGAGLPVSIVLVVSPLVVPLLTAFFATVTAQAVKHRDAVFGDN